MGNIKGNVTVKDEGNVTKNNNFDDFEAKKKEKPKFIICKTETDSLPPKYEINSPFAKKDKKPVKKFSVTKYENFQNENEPEKEERPQPKIDFKFYNTNYDMKFFANEGKI